MLSTLIVIGGVALFAVTPAVAGNSDFGTRIGADVSHEFYNKLGVAVEAEQRFRGNTSIYDKTLIEPSAYYDIVKNFRVGASCRVAYDRSKKGEYTFKQRGSGYVRYRFKLDDFDIRAKVALQYGFDDLTNSSSSNKLINRNSLTVKYQWFGKPITPEAGCEMFYHINNETGAIVNQMRYKLGIAYKINKKSDIKIYYLIDDEFNVKAPTDTHVLGFSYSIEL